VARGIETWALDTARALARRGVDVTLFAGGDDRGQRPEVGGQRLEDGGRRADDGGREAGRPLLDVRRSTFNVQRSPPLRVLPCLRRGNRAAQRLAAFSPRFAWRWGLKDAYGWEQFSFWLHLWPALRRGRFDILHVQDPMLAWWCRRFRRLGLIHTREILAHGTEESPAFLAPFERVQHLAPEHLEKAEGGNLKPESDRKAEGGRREPEAERRSDHRLWTVMPNFVDTVRFRPCADEEKRATRARLGVPEDAFVVGCVAAVKKDHKRVDYLVRAVASLTPVSGFLPPPFLLVAGARTSETPEIVTLARQLVPGRSHFLLDQPREAMPDVYRAMDVMVLPSLFEMMPIAVLEAMASGVPVVVNRTPVLEWMIGGKAEGGDLKPESERNEGGGAAIDMGGEGELEESLRGVTPEWCRERGRAARERAVHVFSEEAVIGQYVEYYRRVTEETADRRPGTE
jgi:glycosyltransferase involved in cell wall biosynthesis